MQQMGTFGNPMEVDLGPLDPLQYPSLVIDALQQEVQTMQHQWKQEVSELEAAIKRCAKDSAELPVVEEMLEFMTSRFEGLLLENADLKKQSVLDVQELEGMIKSLTTENQHLKKKLGDISNPSKHGEMIMQCVLEPTNLDITKVFGDEDKISVHDVVKDFNVNPFLTDPGAATPPLYEPNAEPNAEPVTMATSPGRYTPPRFQNMEPNAEPAAERSPAVCKEASETDGKSGKECGQFFGELEQTMSLLAVDTEKLMEKLKSLQAKVAAPCPGHGAVGHEHLKHSDTLNSEASTRFTLHSQESKASLNDDSDGEVTNREMSPASSKVLSQMSSFDAKTLTPSSSREDLKELKSWQKEAAKASFIVRAKCLARSPRTPRPLSK